MKVAFLLIFVFSFVLLFSQTDVSGNVSGVWTLEDSPYNVVGNITVPNGATLHIDAGVSVIFQGYYKFNIYGNVQAIGTENDSINFLPQNTSVGWHGLRIISSNVTSTFSYCNIMYGKTDDGDYPDNVGGGLLLKDSDAHIDHCKFAYNEATEEGYGIGGAIYAINTTDLQITDCLFYQNSAYGEGGAIRLTNDYNGLIRNCKFISNECGYGGGAIHFYTTVNTRMENTLFYDNTVTISSGGAIASGGMDGNSLIFTNCTITKNTVESYYSKGPAMNLAYAKAMMVNCIVYDNNVSSGDEIFIDVAAECEAHYCDMTEPNSIDFVGSNNIQDNPMFVDEDNGDFHLTENSPCIDAGVAYYQMENYLGQTVVCVDLSEDEYDGSAPDMGTYEFIQSASNGDVLPISISNVYNYPNPFNPTTTINFSLKNRNNVLVVIYNLKGEKVKELLNADMPAGEHFVIWNGDNEFGKKVASGVYLYKINAGNNSVTKTAVLMK